MKSRQWYVVVDGKGMRMITELEVDVDGARELAVSRFGESRVDSVKPADPGEFRKPH